MDIDADTAPKTGSLADYIRQIHYGDYSFERIFDYGITHRPPQLRSDRINRILLYPGSFNPPHRGHLELLHHGFTKSGRDFNIVAAMVLCLDDEALIKKLAGRKDAVIFTKAERVRLWKGYVPSDWYWIYDQSVREWFDFQNRLTRVIKKDGFQVSWVLLCGPYYVGVDCLPSAKQWGCKEIIVSDIGRPANFTCRARNTLTDLNGCEAWKRLVPDLETMQKYASESTSWIVSGMFILSHTAAQLLLNKNPNYIEQTMDELSQEAVQENNSIQVCRRRRRDYSESESESTIRFVPAAYLTPNLSSTRVRETIQSNIPHEQLLKELQELVMFPEILLELLASKPWEERMPPAPMTG